MTFQHGTYLLPLLRGCGSTVRVAVVVQALAGSDLVVHAQGTTTAVSPGWPSSGSSSADGAGTAEAVRWNFGAEADLGIPLTRS
jgi:hypothetical protein